ncbi:Ankyrin repeat and BTB/POZ domain-containing protein 1 [Chytriomyces hyalinus]|nr:Ankyrin repeat and BTB/POZ domain-containing protein 1 [Chytriomyces hyalinus]
MDDTHPLFEDLLLACKTGDLDKVTRLIEFDEVPFNCRDQWDCSPLYYSSLCGHYDVCKFLLEQGASCEPGSFDGERCFYGALTKQIRDLLKNHSFSKAIDSNADFSIFMIKSLFGNSKNSYADLVLTLPNAVESLIPPFHGFEMTVHRSVLAARNAFLAFQIDSRWRNNSFIAVKHQSVSSVALRAFVYYIYTGQLSRDFMQSFASDLEFLARQWKAEQLLPLLLDTSPLAYKLGTHLPGSIKSVQRDLKLLVWCLNHSALASIWNDEQGDEVKLIGNYESYLAGLQQLKDRIARGDFGDTGLTAIEVQSASCLLRAARPDIFIQIGNERIPCHKAFLIRSDYFMAFIEGGFTEASDLRESSGSCAVLPLSFTDNPLVFKCVLEFLYTDSCSRFTNDSDFMLENLIAADLLLLDSLKTAIVNHILTIPFSEIKDPAAFLRSSWAMNLPRLEQYITRFYAASFDQVLSDPEFRVLIKESAESVVNRQDTDTIIFADDLRFWLLRLHGFDGSIDNDVGIVGKKGELLVRVGQNVMNREVECLRKIEALDTVVEELGLLVFPSARLASSNPRNGSSGISKACPFVQGSNSQDEQILLPIMSPILVSDVSKDATLLPYSKQYHGSESRAISAASRKPGRTNQRDSLGTTRNGPPLINRSSRPCTAASRPPLKNQMERRDGFEGALFTPPNTIILQRPSTAATTRLQSEGNNRRPTYSARSRPVSGRIHTSHSTRQITAEFPNLKRLDGPEVDMDFVTERASEHGLFRLVTSSVLPPTVDFSKQLLDKRLVSSARKQIHASKEASNSIRGWHSALCSFNGMVKYEPQANEVVQLRPEFRSISVPVLCSDSTLETPIGTPNWTPNTERYQQPLYPPSQPFFSPRETRRANTPETISEFRYKDPIQKPIATLKDLCHLNTREFSVTDYETFAVSNGKLVSLSPGFSEFQRVVQANHFVTGVSLQSVLFMVRQVEKFCTANLVKWADVSKRKLMEFLQRPLITRITTDDILFCLSNAAEIHAWINSPGHTFRCNGGEVAVGMHVINSTRARLQRIHHLEVIKSRRMAEKVILFRKRILKLRKIQQQIKSRLVYQKPAALDLIRELRENWDSKYSGQKRFVIHLPSISCGKQIRSDMSDLRAKQSQQFGRFRDLLDPNVTLIYVTFPIEDEVKDTFSDYLSNFFFDADFASDSRVTERFHILVPEVHKFFPRNGSLAGLLLNSVNSLKYLSNLVGSTPAYIVPGIIGDQEIALSAILKIPLFCELDLPHALAFNPTEQYKLISRCEVTQPPGEAFSGKSLTAFLETLSTLITDCTSTKRWMFKMNHHTDQAGIAYWDADDMARRKFKLSPQVFKQLLYDSLTEKGKLARDKSVYPTMTEFIDAFLKLGGMIEGAPPVFYENEFLVEEKSRHEFPTRFPSAHYLIYPNGSSELVCSSEQLCIKPYRYWGSVIPQQTCPHDDLAMAAKEIIDCLVHRGYFGYASVDFISWDDHSLARRNLWCIGVKPYLTDSQIYCLNYMTASYTQTIQPGFDHSGCTLLDMNRARAIPFKYLHNNQFIDLRKVKRHARMAAFEGDQDLVNRVGLYSPNFRHYGLMSLTSVGAETLLIDSGFLFDAKNKIGAIALNAERTNKEYMSIMFSDKQHSACLEQALRAIVLLYRRLMTIEAEEVCNFIDIAYCIVPELRRARHREAIFDPSYVHIGQAIPELYKVQWRIENGYLGTSETEDDVSGMGIAIMVEDTENNDVANEYKSAGVLTDGLAAKFEVTNLSPVANVASNDLSVFVSSNDVVSLLTTAENRQIQKRLASNKLEEVVAAAMDLPDYKAIGILDEFNPMNRIRILARRQQLKRFMFPAIRPDPKSIALLNTLIPSNALWGKYADYGDEQHEYQMVLPERFDDPNRIPLGLTPEQYLIFLDVSFVFEGLLTYLLIGTRITAKHEMQDLIEKQEQREEMERIRKIKHEEDMRKAALRQKLQIEEELALAELSLLIAEEKEAYLRSGKGPLTKKVQQEIEDAIRRNFFDRAAQEQMKRDHKGSDARGRKRLKDFMGKKPGRKIGGKGFADLSVGNGYILDGRVSRRESYAFTSNVDEIQSVLMRGIGEKWLGFRAKSEPTLAEEE